MSDDSNRGSNEGDLPPFEDGRFGVFEYDQGEFVAQAEWDGTTVELWIHGYTDENVESALNVARSLWADRTEWTDRFEGAVADELLPLVNGHFRPDDEQPLTADAFARSLTLETVGVSPDGKFDVWHDDGAMDSGHTILVTGTLADGMTDMTLMG